jgi:hypothetical protein
MGAVTLLCLIEFEVRRDLLQRVMARGTSPYGRGLAGLDNRSSAQPAVHLLMPHVIVASPTCQLASAPRRRSPIQPMIGVSSRNGTASATTLNSLI